jgi:glutamate/tyrosine decarboxylase-like PLP-dependent enzyme
MCVTGGHMANHIGVMAALNDKFPEIREKGLTGLNFSPIILLSQKISHYSFYDAAHHLGIGRENVIDIPTTSNFTTDYVELKKILDNLPKNKVPFMVIGVAGNTKTSSLDDLNKLSDLCKKYNLWLHVDACHGGSLLFSEKMKKKLLSGIEKADSISIDPHKGLFLPYLSSYILFKQRGVLSFFSKHPEETQEKDIWELCLITPFYGSRGFESLSLWMMISILGKKGIGETIEYRDRIAKYAENLIEKSGLFIKLNDMEFYRMAFVYCPDKFYRYLVKHGNNLNEKQKKNIVDLMNRYGYKLNQGLYVSGEVCLDKYNLHDVGNKLNLNTKDKFLVMAITIGNPLYTKLSMKNSLGKVFNEAKKITSDFEKEFLLIINECSVAEKFCDIGGPAGW